MLVNTANDLGDAKHCIKTLWMLNSVLMFETVLITMLMLNTVLMLNTFAANTLG